MRTVSFKLPEALDDARTDLVRRRNSRRSVFVREVLDAVEPRMFTGEAVLSEACFGCQNFKPTES